MVLFTGRTVEEAIEKGLNEMQLTRLKAHIKVVSREKHGFLGFGKKPAQVDIEGINEVTAHRADQKAVRGVPDTINQQNTPALETKTQWKDSHPEPHAIQQQRCLLILYL